MAVVELGLGTGGFQVLEILEGKQTEATTGNGKEGFPKSRCFATGFDGGAGFDGGPRRAAAGEERTAARREYRLVWTLVCVLAGYGALEVIA
jgi:hypothetical protein